MGLGIGRLGCRECPQDPIAYMDERSAVFDARMALTPREFRTRKDGVVVVVVSDRVVQSPQHQASLYFVDVECFLHHRSHARRVGDGPYPVASGQDTARAS